MKKTRTLAALVPLGVIVVVACSVSDEAGTTTGTAQTASPEEAPAAPGGPAAIDVAPDSRVSLGMRGGLGPMVGDQTVTQAVVTLEDVELVSESGASVSLVQGSFSADLLSVQNDLQQLVDQQALEAGRYTSLRFRLTSAFIETVDAQQVTRVFASQGIDTSQFTSVGSVGTLDLGGIGPDGFVTVALPDEGIEVQGAASLAMHFVLAQSLSMQSADTWVLDPRVWLVDASAFASLDVQFEASESFSQYISSGFEVVLFDAGLRPICSAALVQSSTTIFSASFRYLESFEGPFVAVLVPPSGISLQSAVAVSVEVQQSVHAETHISVSSIQQVSQVAGATVLDVRASNSAVVVERSSAGAVIRQTTGRVGTIDQVVPSTLPTEPLRRGERQHRKEAPPALRGLPTPQGHTGPPAPPPPTSRPDAGAPPPVRDGGLPPARDAGARPEHDAGAPPERDAGAPPERDAGAPHERDAGARPMHDAGAPPMRDAGAPPPMHDAGARPEHDAGAPPPMRDAGAPHGPPSGTGTPPAPPSGTGTPHGPPSGTGTPHGPPSGTGTPTAPSPTGPGATTPPSPPTGGGAPTSPPPTRGGVGHGGGHRDAGAPSH